MTLLEVERLAIGFRRYRGLLGRTTIQVLHDVTLSAAPGEVVGVIGASGAGKTLLFDAILGLLPPNAGISGILRFEGVQLDSVGVQRLRGRAIALVPQNADALDPLRRAGAQIRRAARLSGLDRAAAHAATRTTAARYGLDAAALDRRPAALSGGMARRVLLAMATAGGARLILADEPTVGLDAANAWAVLSHLRALADEGRAVVVVSHDLRALARIADRIAVLHAGTTVAVERAAAFAADGAGLQSAHARRLWRALPGVRTTVGAA